MVIVAAKPEGGGWYQFPGITRWPDRTLGATWQMQADSITNYGKDGSSSAVSTGSGKTWQPWSGKSKAVGGLLLPNGDRISITTPKAVPTSELKMPESVGGADETYSKIEMLLYKLSDLPSDQQIVPINRLAKGRANWRSEKAKSIDPLAPVRRSDYLQNPATVGGYGIPRNEDGSDTFGQYLNGGCLVNDAVYFITALHITSEHEKADRILRAMLER